MYRHTLAKYDVIIRQTRCSVHCIGWFVHCLDVVHVCTPRHSPSCSVTYVRLDLQNMLLRVSMKLSMTWHTRLRKQK